MMRRAAATVKLRYRPRHAAGVVYRPRRLVGPGTRWVRGLAATRFDGRRIEPSGPPPSVSIDTQEPSPAATSDPSSSRWARIGQRLGGAGWPLISVVALVVVALSWPFRSLPAFTMDVSWQVGLHQAADQGLRFGQDLVFTYGPLGFLAWPTPFTGATSSLAFIVSVAIYLAMVVLLLGAARRMFPLVVAIVVVLLFARILGYLGPSETLQVIVFAVGVDLIRRDRVARPAVVATLLGALAAAALLGKLNIGLSVAAMTVVVVLAISPRRLSGFLVFSAAFVATFLAFWLATGQPLSDLVPYVKGSMEIISGYSDAMSRNGPGGRWIYVLFLVASATLAYLTWRISTGWPSRRRLPLAALLLLFLFAQWKLAFVRDTPTPAFASLAFAAFLLLPARLPRPMAVIVLIAFGVTFVGVSRVPPGTYADVVTSATEFVRQARDDLLPWRWSGAEDETSGYLQSHFAVPPEMLAAIAGHSVNIDPVAEGVATAYPGFTWRPQPIFQSYSAYTTYLDQLNADQLRSPARPERILRQVDAPGSQGGRSIAPAIDGRFYWFEAPEATIERLCRYREVGANGGWQLLADTGRACGVPQPISTVTAQPGESVTVPPAPGPDDIVAVRVHGIGQGLTARLRSVLWKAPISRVVLDGFGYRLVPGTAPDGLVLAVPSAIQGSAPFAFGPPIKTISISGPSGGGPLTYEFVAIPLPPS